MPVSYARFVKAHPIVLRRKKADVGMLRVLIFDPVLEEYRSISLGDRYRLMEVGTRDVDVVIFRESRGWEGENEQAFSDLITSDPILKRLLADSLVGILRPRVAQREAPELVWLDQENRSAHKARDWLSLVREFETSAFIDSTGAFRRESNRHYVLPSGDHADAFVSIRRLLSDPLNVDRLADWVGPELGGIQGILLDQEAMLPLGLAVQALEFHLSGIMPPVRVLGEYPADVMTLHDAVSALSDDVSRHRCLLFLLSISCSGRLERSFRAIAPVGSRFMLLLSGLDGEQPQGQPPLLSVPIQRYAVGDHDTCQLCNEASQAQRVDPRTYEPGAMLSSKKLPLNFDRVKPTSRFWGIADEADAVALHYDDSDTGRHHPVYIKTRRLLAHPGFRSRCLEVLSGTGRPDLVVIPGHASSGLLKDLVREAFVEQKIEVLPSESSRIPEDARPRLAAASRILLVDDAIITTKTLLDLKFQIYDLSRDFGRSVALKAFVVLARPEDSQALRDLKNRFHDGTRAQVYPAWSILLPYPNRKNCTFCQERELLARYLPQLGELARAQATLRLEGLQGTLADPARGEYEGRRIDGSFLVADESDTPINALPRTIYGAAQSAGMTLRDEIERRTEEEGRLYTVDDSDLLAKFFDSEIVGALLRTLRRRFLSWPINEERMLAKLNSFPTGPQSQNVLYELAWAAVLGRLPFRPLLHLLDKAPPDGQTELLKELIHANVLASQED